MTATTHTTLTSPQNHTLPRKDIESWLLHHPVDSYRIVHGVDVIIRIIPNFIQKDTVTLIIISSPEQRLDNETFKGHTFRKTSAINDCMDQLAQRISSVYAS